MDLGAFRFLAVGGGEWVIHLLVFCSVLTVAVVLERAWVTARELNRLSNLRPKIVKPLEDGDWKTSTEVLGEVPGAASAILASGVRNVELGPAAVEEHLAAQRSREKQILERRLLILGTLGNNAPFIGLFGTVLGVIKAFHDLAAQSDAGPEVVMQGLSEALVATAVGLLVAIPAVMAFNYYQKKVNDILAETDALSRLIVARLKSVPRR
jgi:biopolymer transport protein ExbB